MSDMTIPILSRESTETEDKYNEKSYFAKLDLKIQQKSYDQDKE